MTPGRRCVPPPYSLSILQAYLSNTLHTFILEASIWLIGDRPSIYLSNTLWIRIWDDCLTHNVSSSDCFFPSLLEMGNWIKKSWTKWSQSVSISLSNLQHEGKIMCTIKWCWYWFIKWEYPQQKADMLVQHLGARWSVTSLYFYYSTLLLIYDPFSPVFFFLTDIQPKESYNSIYFMTLFI